MGLSYWSGDPNKSNGSSSSTASSTSSTSTSSSSAQSSSTSNAPPGGSSFELQREINDRRLALNTAYSSTASSSSTNLTNTTAASSIASTSATAGSALPRPNDNSMLTLDEFLRETSLSNAVGSDAERQLTLLLTTRGSRRLDMMRGPNADDAADAEVSNIQPPPPRQTETRRPERRSTRPIPHGSPGEMVDIEGRRIEARRIESSRRLNPATIAALAELHAAAAAALPPREETGTLAEAEARAASPTSRRTRTTGMQPQGILIRLQATIPSRRTMPRLQEFTADGGRRPLPQSRPTLDYAAAVTTEPIIQTFNFPGGGGAVVRTGTTTGGAGGGAGGNHDSFDTLVGQIRRIGALQDVMLTNVDDATTTAVATASTLTSTALAPGPGAAERDRDRGSAVASLRIREAQLRAMQTRIDLLASEFALLRNTRRELRRVEAEALRVLPNLPPNTINTAYANAAEEAAMAERERRLAETSNAYSELSNLEMAISRAEGILAEDGENVYTGSRMQDAANQAYDRIMARRLAGRADNMAMVNVLVERAATAARRAGAERPVVALPPRTPTTATNVPASIDRRSCVVTKEERHMMLREALMQMQMQKLP